MDKVLSVVISRIKEQMNDHAHGAMNIANVDDSKFHEIAGAYRGMQHCLDIIDNVLHDKYEEDLKV